MNSILNLVLFLSDFIQIVLNNIVVLIVTPLNVLASIIYQLGERVGLIEGEEEQEEKNNPIGFKIMSDKTRVDD